MLNLIDMDYKIYLEVSQIKIRPYHQYLNFKNMIESSNLKKKIKKIEFNKKI